MIETIQWNQPSPTPAKPQKAVLHRVANERTAGTIPVWGQPKSPTQKVEQTLSMVQDVEAIDPYASAYQSPQSTKIPEEFTFGDLVDMANPLHHIPIVNVAYREITGDTMKPIGNIVGGAIFGGPIGAAGGLVNAIIQAETGKDIGGNAISMFKGEKETKFVMKDKSSNARIAKPAEPMQWNKYGEGGKGDLSLALLSFGDLRQGFSAI